MKAKDNMNEGWCDEKLKVCLFIESEAKLTKVFCFLPDFLNFFLHFFLGGKTKNNCNNGQGSSAAQASSSTCQNR